MKALVAEKMLEPTPEVLYNLIINGVGLPQLGMEPHNSRWVEVAQGQRVRLLRELIQEVSSGGLKDKSTEAFTGPGFP